MKLNDNDIFNHYITLYDENEFYSIMAIRNKDKQFQELKMYACAAVQRWNDVFKLSEDVPLLRLQTNIIAQYKGSALPLVSTAQHEASLQYHLSNYFKQLATLVEKAKKELERKEDNDDDDIEWIEEAEDYDGFMASFHTRYQEGTAEYFKDAKLYVIEEINDWYNELKDELTDSDSKEDFGARKCRQLLKQVKQLKDTYSALVNAASDESEFEIAVFDFATYSAKLEYEIENLDEDDIDEDEEDLEERREERREQAAEVASIVAKGAGVAVKTTGKVIWKIISFPFWLIWQILKFLFGTKFGRVLLALIILAAAGLAIWLTKVYEPVIDWVTGLFKTDDSKNDDEPDTETPTDTSNFTFGFTADGRYGISKFEGTATEIIIPSTNNNHTITVIGDSAFKDCSNLKSITIPDSITSIGINAFWGCSSLTEITIPDSVKSIGGSSFAYCTSLVSINLPSKLTAIGDSMFGGCSGLTSITIPTTVKSIGYNAFMRCSALTSITIPNSVTTIGYSAFSNCSKLTNVVLSDNLTTISEELFAGSGITNITLPSKVTTIGDSAFQSCSNLTSIIIPHSLTTIGWMTFFSCSDLNKVYYTGTVEDWENISINTLGNSDLTNATRYYYSDTALSSSGNYWHYDNYDKPVVW